MGATLGSANHLLRHPKRISNAGLKKCQYSGTGLHIKGDQRHPYSKLF
jgi:hypothetical protein